MKLKDHYFRKIVDPSDKYGFSVNPYGTSHFIRTTPANIYLFKVNKRNTRKRYDICSQLTIKISETRHLYFYY